MVNIKLHTNWCSDVEFREHFNRSTIGGDYIWKDMYLTLDENYDYLCVFNYPANHIQDTSNVILFECEPPESVHTKCHNDFISGRKFFKVYDTKSYHNMDKWYISLNYRQLCDPSLFIKTKVMSGIVSGLNGLEGHKDRLKFVNLLDGIDGYNHFGRNGPPIKSYKGALNNKEDGMRRYKYHFNGENSYSDGYFTEKLIDAILCECLCFYSGCPNVGKYIDERCFIRLNLKNQEESLAIVKTAIENNEWEKRIDYIRQEKNKLMTEMNPLNIIWKIVNNAPL
jgi:hypothetical protein